MFLVALSEYDQVLFEAGNEVDSLQFFCSFARSFAKRSRSESTVAFSALSLVATVAQLANLLAYYHLHTISF